MFPFLNLHIVKNCEALDNFLFFDKEDVKPFLLTLSYQKSSLTSILTPTISSHTRGD